MSLYKYSVKNEHGETIKGKVEAKSVEMAASALSSRGLLVIDLHPLNEGSFLSIKTMLFGIGQDEVVNFTRQLSTMITAGLALSTSLSILSEQGKPEFMKLVAGLLKDIEGGSTFSKALAKKPEVFSRVYVQLVRAGEVGGVLDEMMSRLADSLEKEKEFRSKTKGALIYPMIVVIAMVIVAFVMMIFVIPKLTELYQDFGADLPFLTQLLIDTSSFTARLWWLFLLLPFVGGAFFRSWGKTITGRRTIDSFKLKIPVFGVLRRKVILTEFSRTLSLLLTAGISLLEALEIVAESIDNLVYREALKEVNERVEKGIAFSQGLSVHTVFPPILYQMVAVGEETGKLDEVLLKISIYFQAESEQAIKNLTTALEPMIMIVLGVGVGVMVTAIIMPIYNLTSQF